MYGYDPDFHVDVEGDVSPGRAPAALDRIKKLQELRDSQEPRGQVQEPQKKYYDHRQNQEVAGTERRSVKN
jgi:hypothetical protein